MSKFSWSQELEQKVNLVKTHLLKQAEAKWLCEVLRYLPEGHLFNTTAYLNLGYDHIVLGENIALNMGSRQFISDKRESVYYLIHELAHAGYCRYHALPRLWNSKTNEKLARIVKFLTHLEGMGVLSALRFRMSEGGLLDNDYKILLNSKEKARRVKQYFEILSKLEDNPHEQVQMPYSQIFEEMSGKDTRLWYVTGCHMAQEIERQAGVETLITLVKRGSGDFFATFRELDPFSR
jgi:hypothetical protein